MQSELVREIYTRGIYELQAVCQYVRDRFNDVILIDSSV